MTNYTPHQIASRTGRELLEDLGVTATGESASFTVNEKRALAWMTIGRGKHTGKGYGHIRIKHTIPVVASDTREKLAATEEVIHFRGRLDDAITDYVVV